MIPNGITNGFREHGPAKGAFGLEAVCSQAGARAHAPSGSRMQLCWRPYAAVLGIDRAQPPEDWRGVLVCNPICFVQPSRLVQGRMNLH